MKHEYMSEVATPPGFGNFTINDPSKHIINLTPHDMKILCHVKSADNSIERTTIDVPASGRIARVNTPQVAPLPFVKFPLNGNGTKQTIIECKKQKFGEIVGLPEKIPNGPKYIVSNIVLMAVKEKNPERDDVFAPNTTHAIRDEYGKIVSIPGLVR